MALDDEINSRTDDVLQSLTISISALTARTSMTLAEFIETQKVAGLSDDLIESLLIADLNEGGRIFGEFKRSLGLNVTGSFGEVANEAADAVFGGGPDTRKIWIAALVNTCPDCLPRHGIIETDETWKSLGKPRTGWSVCRRNCQCNLLLAEDAEGREELKEPLKR